MSVYDCDYPYTLLPPRRCLLEPIPEIYLAQLHLIDAADCHCQPNSDRKMVEELICKADKPEIVEWMDSIWGPWNCSVHRRLVEKIEKSEYVPEKARANKNIPTALKRSVIKRDRYHCRWCGIPVISVEARDHLKRIYPNALRWGPSNDDKHAAFLAMTLSVSRVIPRSRGGKNLMDNLVVSCGPCSAGRKEFFPREVCLIHPIPEKGPWITSDWDGLIRVFRN